MTAKEPTNPSSKQAPKSARRAAVKGDDAVKAKAVTDASKAASSATRPPPQKKAVAAKATSKTTPAASSRPSATRARAARSSASSTLSGSWMLRVKRKFPVYLQLMRLDKPIGSLLLLWPTLWSLWLAARGVPSLKNLVIFILGVLVMRSAGCVINDFADRKIDGRVKRTQRRPLATGAVTPQEAIGLFIGLSLLAFGLVLLTNPLTIKLSVGGLLLAFCYPFMKRYTHLPQIVLGAAFSWGIPMAYAAETGTIPDSIWLVYLANLLWTVAYDTFYAMVDRDDDLKIGVKSTAVLFGEQDRLITALLQGLCLYCLYLVGVRFDLGTYYWLGLTLAGGLFIYQQWLIRYRVREACFKAFLNNNWAGAAVLMGMAIDLAIG